MPASTSALRHFDLLRVKQIHDWIARCQLTRLGSTMVQVCMGHLQRASMSFLRTSRKSAVCDPGS